MATVRSGQAETLPDHQGRYLLPSVVNYHASGLTVGYDARLNAAQDPANTISSVKRMMGRSRRYSKPLPASAVSAAGQ
nr:Hsc66 [Klebsiella pneumoniae]